MFHRLHLALLTLPIGLGLIGCQPSSTEPAPLTSASRAEIKVPDPDTTGTERLVAEKIPRGRERVLAAPDSAAAWGQLGMVFDVHNFVGAGLHCYQQAERLDSTDFRWPYMSAVCMPDAGPAERIEVLQRAHQLRPRYAPAMIRLANERVQLGQWEEARSLFAQALREPSVVSHALLGLARVDFAEDRVEQARERLEAALANNPRHNEVYVLLAQVYRSLGETEKAQASATQAALAQGQGKTPLLDPARTEVMFEGTTASQLARQGNRLRARGEFDAAIQKLRLSIEADPKNPMAHFDLGLALASLGEWDAGLAALNESLVVDPNFEPARKAIEAVRQERDRLK